MATTTSVASTTAAAAAAAASGETLRSGADAQSFIIELSTLEEIVEGLVQQTVGLLESTPSFDAAAFSKEIVTLVSQGKLLDLVYKLLSGLSGTFAAIKEEEENEAGDDDEEEEEEDNEETVETLFALLFTLIKHVDAKTQLPGVVGEVCKVVASAVDAAAVVRLRILRNLYAVMEADSGLRASVFLSLLRYATSANLQAGLSLSADGVRELCASWNVTTEIKREIMLLACNALHASRQIEAAHAVNMQYLGTFQGASAADLGAASVLGARAALHVVKSPLRIENFSVMDQAAVRYLENIPEHAALFKLLRIVVEGSFADYNAFAASHKDYASQLGLDADFIAERMRLLTLGSLAADNLELGYAAIAEALQIPEDDVEEWIVRAIGHKLLDGKMDQINALVIVNSGTARGFTNKSWTDLSKKLHAWRTGIRNLLQTVQEAREQAAEMSGK